MSINLFLIYIIQYIINYWQFGHFSFDLVEPYSQDQQTESNENNQSMLGQKHYDFSDENNKVSFEGVPHKSSLVPQLDISDSQ